MTKNWWKIPWLQLHLTNTSDSNSFFSLCLKSFSYRRLVNCPLTFCSAHCSQIAIQDWVTDIWSLRDDGYLIIIHVASFSYYFFLNCEYDLVAHHRSCLCLRMRGRLKSGWRPEVFWKESYIFFHPNACDFFAHSSAPRDSPSDTVVPRARLCCRFWWCSSGDGLHLWRRRWSRNRCRLNGTCRGLKWPENNLGEWRACLAMGIDKLELLHNLTRPVQSFCSIPQFGTTSCQKHTIGTLS